MTKDLIIVESPAKVKTIKKFLGSKYNVQASVGHIRDLPTSTLGVDEKNNYAPEYKIIEGKEKVVGDLQSAAAKADTVYLAPDPDREGEAIAWHIAELLKGTTKAAIKRIQFNEITAKAVREALEHPRGLDQNLFDAQQARRVLDRLVGYKISPLLWVKVKRGISAGRVQSVALRLIVEREKARHAFVPVEYWPFHATFSAGKDIKPEFRTELVKVDGKKAALDNEKKAGELEKRLKGQAFKVSALEVKLKEKTPPPPFITSTLQQNANQRLGYTSKRTMGIAQRLYEGVDLGGDLGLTALITYMRTDSVRISEEARTQAKDFILKTWGEEYYPAKARVFKSKASAQDAHEAIRPVDANIRPDEIKASLTAEQYNLYRMIWNRFMASQMAGAKVEDTTVLVEAARTEWKAKGERVLFPGFLTLTPQKDEDSEDLPPLQSGQELILVKLEKEQKFTLPPARYNEASLVKELEEKGIGRPSTYASIISTLQDREYVTLAEKNFTPTDLGVVVSDLLSEHFHELMDVGFTAQMEGLLDKVADGEQNWVELLTTFAASFNPVLAEAAKAMKTVKGGMPAGVDCPDCGKPMQIKFGKAGPFLACSGYPECRCTRNFSRNEQGIVQIEERQPEEAQVCGKCPDCGKDLYLKKARTGSRFIACSGYPACKHAEPFSTGVPCPKCKDGRIVEKSSHRGKIFYSCDQYPKCDYALWYYPVAESCPDCGSPVLVKKTLKAGSFLACPNKECKYKKALEAD
ncbi:MAG: type I DNA topoisomerase [Deltaproteobacteria bacterium]|jgi:DNA topoisomerase-1|nr:type I DNA topoisomerase [Deltaproteobacteria bacterium]